MDPQMQELFRLILENQTSIMNSLRHQLGYHASDSAAGIRADLCQQIGYTDQKLKELQDAPQGR